MLLTRLVNFKLENCIWIDKLHVDKWTNFIISTAWLFQCQPKEKARSLFKCIVNRTMRSQRSYKKINLKQGLQYYFLCCVIYYLNVFIFKINAVQINFNILSTAHFAFVNIKELIYLNIWSNYSDKKFFRSWALWDCKII